VEYQGYQEQKEIKVSKETVVFKAQKEKWDTKEIKVTRYVHVYKLHNNFRGIIGGWAF